VITRRLRISAFVLVMLILPVTSIAVEIARFSSLPAESGFAPWRETGLRKQPRTRFSLVTDERGVIVVRADSSAAVAGLVHDIHADPREYPVIEWRWKIARLIQAADISRKGDDDFPARVYVMFDYDLKRLSWFARAKLRMACLFYGNAVPAAALCYVWDRNTPVDTIAPNAYTDRTRMIVVQSGADKLNEWVFESRNVYEDFRLAFGEDPPKITGIAIATDTDNMGESAVAWFGDVRLIMAATH